VERRHLTQVCVGGGGQGGTWNQVWEGGGTRRYLEPGVGGSGGKEVLQPGVGEGVTGSLFRWGV
jgi:hypothetical protein